MDRRHQSVSVMVRVRPMRTEIGEEASGWDVSDNMLVERGNPDIRFSFDKVFTGGSSTKDIYDECVAGPVVQSCMAGFNATVFAYGQTSSGKSYTMLGEGSSPGIVPLAVEDMFNISAEQQQHGKDFVIKCSMMEIYNEQLRDLLADPANPPTPLRIVKSPLRGVYVEGAIRRPVTSVRQFVDYIHAEAEARRVSASHSMNLRSSRSHCIVRLDVECWENDGSAENGGGPSAANNTSAVTDASDLPNAKDGDNISVSALHLVDLAGSERISKTGASSGIRKIEGANINKSLLFLGTVIERLSDPDHKGYIPYRDSVLTRMLQTALGGNSVTSVIAAITEADIHREETRSTLQFAYRASRIKNVVHRNEISDDKTRIRKLEGDVKGLRKSLVAKQFSILLANTRLKKFQVDGTGGSGYNAHQTARIVASLQQSNAALQGEIAALKESGGAGGGADQTELVQQLNLRLETYEQQQREMEEDAKQMQESQETLEQLCKELEHDNDQQVRKVDRFRKVMKSTEAQCETLRNANVELQDRVLALEAEKKKLADSFESSIEKARSSSDADLRRELAETRAKLLEVDEKNTTLIELYSQAEVKQKQQAAAHVDADAEHARETEALRNKYQQQVQLCRRLVDLGALVSGGGAGATSPPRVHTDGGEEECVKEREVDQVEKLIRNFIASRANHPPQVVQAEGGGAAASSAAASSPTQTAPMSRPYSTLRQLSKNVAHLQSSTYRDPAAVCGENEFADSAHVKIKGMSADGERPAVRTRRRPPNALSKAGAAVAPAEKPDASSACNTSNVSVLSSAAGGDVLGAENSAFLREKVSALEEQIALRDSQRDVLVDTKLKRMQDLLIRVHNNCLNLQTVVHSLSNESTQLKDFITMRKLTHKLPPNLRGGTPSGAELIEAAKNRPSLADVGSPPAGTSNRRIAMNADGNGNDTDNEEELDENDQRAIAQLAIAAEVSEGAAELLLDVCGWDMDEAFEAFFSGRFTREDLEADTARLRREPVPACQFYWNGHCAKGDACALRHDDAADNAARTSGGGGGVLFTRPPEDMSYEELLDLQESMGKVQLSVCAATRASLARVPYSPTQTATANALSGTTCSVCLEDFARGDDTLVLPCRHRFHVGCIERCMDVNKHCPVCKREIVAPLVPAAGVEARAAGQPSF